MICSQCGGPNPARTPFCGHIMCINCIERYINWAQRKAAK